MPKPKASPAQNNKSLPKHTAKHKTANSQGEGGDIINNPVLTAPLMDAAAMEDQVSMVGVSYLCTKCHRQKCMMAAVEWRGR